jgi:hypothetical protein
MVSMARDFLESISVFLLLAHGFGPKVVLLVGQDGIHVNLLRGVNDFDDQSVLVAADVKDRECV